MLSLIQSAAGYYTAKTKVPTLQHQQLWALNFSFSFPNSSRTIIIIIIIVILNSIKDEPFILFIFPATHHHHTFCRIISFRQRNSLCLVKNIHPSSQRRSPASQGSLYHPMLLFTVSCCGNIRLNIILFPICHNKSLQFDASKDHKQNSICPLSQHKSLFLLCAR